MSPPWEGLLIFLYFLCISLTIWNLTDNYISVMMSQAQKFQFSSVQSLSHVWLFATPWIAAFQASLSSTNSWSLLKPMSIKSVMPSSHPILCRPLLFLSPITPSIRVFSNESTLHIRWPKYWSFSFSISPSNEHPRLISFRMDWLKLLAVQGTLKSLLQHHRSKASILRLSAFFMVLLKMIVTGLWWLSGKRFICQCWRCGFDPWAGKILNAEEQHSPQPEWNNCWACAKEPESHNSWAHVLQWLKAMCPRGCAPQQENCLTPRRSPLTATRE